MIILFPYFSNVDTSVLLKVKIFEVVYQLSIQIMVLKLFRKCNVCVQNPFNKVMKS